MRQRATAEQTEELGQSCTSNANNHVIRFVLAQVQMGTFERVDYKFLVKGHTKNSCDRGFGHIRKHVSRVDCWTMDHVVAPVNDSATSNRTVHITGGNDFFKSYKPILEELYKNLVGVQQFQIFSVHQNTPGVVQCKKGPEDNAVEKDLRRKEDDLAPPPEKIEKIAELHNNIRPYVPGEFQPDTMYSAPTKDQEEDAKQPSKLAATTELLLQRLLKPTKTAVAETTMKKTLLHRKSHARDREQRLRPRLIRDDAYVQRQTNCY
ncbi:hypothetical protein ON010_g18866 [Phytophthora cinnamomi]|nr:hypothetical protein ON010_g18866 [Phytophthora cinnamomi]